MLPTAPPRTLRVRGKVDSAKGPSLPFHTPAVRHSSSGWLQSLLAASVRAHKPSFRCSIICCVAVVLFVGYGSFALQCMGTLCEVRFEEAAILESFSESDILDWVAALEGGEIVTSRWMENSVSTKFEAVVHWKGKFYRCVVKVFGGEYPWSFPVSWSRVSQADDVEMSGVTFGRWTDNGRDQGVGELLSFHTARLLRVRNRPPMVARVLASSSLFTFHHGWTRVFPSVWAVYARAIRILSPPLYIVRAFWPATFQLNAVLIPWLPLEEHHPPSEAVRALMAGQAASNPRSHEVELAYVASDMLVLDYLLDDDDRQWTKNWVWGQDERWVHWDNGLAFSGGPLHGGNDKVLCTQPASNKYEKVQSRKRCPKLCLFRPGMVQRLRHLHSRDFGSAVIESVRSSVPDAVWNQNLYISRNDHLLPLWPLHFAPEDYAMGFNARLGDLLAHIEGCSDQLSNSLY